MGPFEKRMGSFLLKESGEKKSISFFSVARERFSITRYNKLLLQNEDFI
jgi:hypothetical protein